MGELRSAKPLLPVQLIVPLPALSAYSLPSSEPM
jgi:hypothetical protein